MQERGSPDNGSDRPNHRYYAGCQGAWRAAVSLRITDPVRLASSGMGFGNRVGLRVMTAWPLWLGAFSLDTTVTYDASGRVLHTTVIRWLGIPIQRSHETIMLDEAGHRFTVSDGMTGTGTIDETARRAEYDLHWLGVQIHQSALRSDDLVIVSQTGPGFESEQRLVRQSRT